MSQAKPTERFSDRVADYVKYRPGYPDELLDLLEDEGLVGPGRQVADVGAGTGIFTKMLVERGCEVWAVEPNQPMRTAMEAQLCGMKGSCYTVDATAEHTTLPDGRFDLVCAAQAYHWFDPEAARCEFGRILKPEGQVALIWNSRRKSSTPFLEEFEQLIVRFGTDYDAVDHTRLEVREKLAPFFGHDDFQDAVFDNAQVLDFDGLRGRLESCSYIPQAGHADYDRMIEALRELFGRFEEDGTVVVEYDMRVFWGRLS
jgi:SAM-dependent methyltransferase